MSRLWTDGEDRVVRWATRRGIPRKVIGREIDRTAQAIRHRERRLGVLPVDGQRACFGWNFGFEGPRSPAQAAPQLFAAE